MKKISTLFILSCIMVMLFSACSQENSPSQGSNTDTESQAVLTDTVKTDTVQTSSEAEEESKAAESSTEEEPIPELMLLDGSAALADEITAYDKADRYNQLDYDSYTVNLCFCVPIGTVSEKRTAYEKGDWVKLEAGTEINGYTVEKAESSYFQLIETVNTENLLFLPIKLVQEVTLNGEFSCTGEACKALAPDGSETGEIVLTLDRESCDSLFSLKPALKTFNDFQEFRATSADEYFENEKIYFYIDDTTEGFKQIMDNLSDTESVNVKLKADGFRLRYTFETGMLYDGINVGYADGGTVSLT